MTNGANSTHSIMGTSGHYAPKTSCGSLVPASGSTVALSLWHSPRGVPKQRQDFAVAPGRSRLHMLCHNLLVAKIASGIYSASGKEGRVDGDRLAKSYRRWVLVQTLTVLLPKTVLKCKSNGLVSRGA